MIEELKFTSSRAVKNLSSPVRSEMNFSVREFFCSRILWFPREVGEMNWNWKVNFAPLNFQHELPNKNTNFWRCHHGTPHTGICEIGKVTIGPIEPTQPTQTR